MKILKIEDKKGYYVKKTLDYDLIDKITKEGLFDLIEFVIDNDESVFDDSSVHEIVNPAQKIIYNNVIARLLEIESQRQTILSNKSKVYTAAIEKYGKK
ncbi:MAG: hypothetical protein RBQ97_05290 [Acholeplasma sp.]|nr:hypothetical protein [Acholeplasma sp.]